MLIAEIEQPVEELLEPPQPIASNITSNPKPIFMRGL
jgi:hypothetical protein